MATLRDSEGVVCVCGLMAPVATTFVLLYGCA